MAAEPPEPKRLKEEMAEPQPPAAEKSTAESAGELCFTAKKSVGGVATTIEVNLPKSAKVCDLAARLATHEGCEPSLITLVCKGKVLSQAAAALQPLAEAEAPGAKVVIVYIVRKPAGAPAAAAAPAPQAAKGPSAAVAAPAAVAVAAPTVGTGAAASSAASGAGPPSVAQPADGAPGNVGRRVLLLLRHGQCMHEHEHDEMKALTTAGHLQAEESARYVGELFSSGKVPSQRALLHSTSRRARETAAKLPGRLPGIETWNADLLRETDPTSNPLRAEEVFMRLFAPPVAGSSDTLIVVAHNNIILYLLMRAAGVPIERAAQAWALFHLRHASVTRIDISETGATQVVSIGAAGHIPHSHVTWNNIKGADMAAWKGGGAERHKFSGRMMVLVRQAAIGGGEQSEAVAAHIKGLSDYMLSAHLTVTCTVGAQETGGAVAQQFRGKLKVFPDSISEHPESGFLTFFVPPAEHSRDTVVMIADHGPVLYWLLRALHMSPEEAKASSAMYCINHASVTLVNVRSDGSMKVVTVGDFGHLPLMCP